MDSTWLTFSTEPSGEVPGLAGEQDRGEYRGDGQEEGHGQRDVPSRAWCGA